ncbi:hypothetical protein F5X68DRAFT_136546 [Plectosphaerella plurivora]|uniref:NAD(P)-binding protein n=1 Tax=Plectosphaerella plurivora TaxID=936078 RepID=A0A9P8V714_9PEZI|nr:hypothetical protein F5X68DRAFT_136546 [Plectosphaerella plurivora]
MSFPPYTKVFHHATYSGIDPSRPELSTAGKVIVITGGGSGMGPRMAHAFATSGATKIAIIGRTESSLKQTKQELEAAHAGVTVHTSVANISDETGVRSAFAAISQAFGKIDILIGNAGYLPDIKPIAEADIEEWFRGISINTKGTLILSKVFLEHASQNPTLVHVSTGGCHIAPMPANSAYAVSKLAAAKLMEYFAAENPHVRVHNIHPGVVPTTGMSKKHSEGGGPELIGDDINLPASFVVWIVSPEAEFLRGKFVWSNWDVEELKAKREQLLSSEDLTLGLIGWP